MRAGNGSTSVRLGRFRAAWRNALQPPELEGDASRRFMTLAHSVRFAVGIAAIAAAPFLSNVHPNRRVALAVLVAFVYLPYTFVIGRVSTRSHRRSARAAMVLGDVGMVFLFSVLVPDTRTVALFGYLLLVAFHTLLGGLAMGVTIAVAVMPLLATAEWLSAVRQVDGYTAVMFFAVLVILAVIVERATEERRRTARFLTRLQDTIAAVSAAPDLDDTIHSVARAAREAVDAKFVSVLVRDGDEVVQGALEGNHDPDPVARSSEMIAAILREPETSPSGIVLTTGERVVVPVVAEDPRFSRWIPEAERQGFTSTIAVPLHAGETVIGVLAAYLRSPDLVGDDNVELLAAYAEHASLVILRALAFEHERKAAARLAEADAIKSELVSTVSHELRTPLTAVKGFVETVLRHWDRFDDNERRTLLERSLRNANQLSELIDQVLDYSRLEAGAVITVAAPVDLAAETGRIVGDRVMLLADHPVTLDLSPAWAEADGEGLERVLDNLLSNAAKYSPVGTPVTVTTEVLGDEAVVSVADRGPGIAADDQERIFDRFYRVNGGRGVRGTGIGLAIVKRYVELMGGRIWVESDVGRGSKFSFALPLAPATAGLSLYPQPAAG